MKIQSPYLTYKRYQTLRTDKITSLPIVILMPHSACNCRCIMCDIWKGNHNLKQLTEADISGLVTALHKYETKQVLMTGGEALLNSNFFRFCEILRKNKIRISLLSTGITLGKNAARLVEWVDDIIISLDGPETLHNSIRNIPDAFQKMKIGIEALRKLSSKYKVSGRTVIQQLNFKSWPAIIETAKEIGLNSISFLPADVSSSAFNRPEEWTAGKQGEILLANHELTELSDIIEDLILRYEEDFASHFILESPDKLRRIYQYYAAHHGYNDFPYKKCNAPWVSAVIEANGDVRPCFFHETYGNIKTKTLDQIINSPEAIAFRKNLDMDNNETCLKCVCYLNLKPSSRI